jgi:hypothetical protein
MSELAAKARELADNLAADVRVASTRLDHILRTQRALEAERLAQELESLAASATVEV